MLRFGVIGCGNFGAELARVLHELEGTRVAAVTGGADDSAKLLAGELNCEMTDSVEELAGRSDIDAIVVASPNDLHKEHVLLAAHNRKHVFCEKPIALSSTDCEEMIKACGNASVQLMAGHILHFLDGIRRVKQLITGGAIGRPLVVHAERTGWLDKRTGSGWKHDPGRTGGLLFHFIHELDLIQAFLGPASSALLAGGNINPGEAAPGSIPDNLLLTLEFSNGAVGTMQYGSGFRWGGHFVKINGTEGAVLIDFQRSEISVKTISGIETFGINGKPEEDEERRGSYLQLDGKTAFTGPNSRPPQFLRSAIQAEMIRLRDAIQGKPVEEEFAMLFDGTAARDSVATAEAAMSSLTKHAWVKAKP